MTTDSFLDKVERVREYLEANPTHGRVRISVALSISQASTARCLRVIKKQAPAIGQSSVSSPKKFVDLDVQKNTACASSCHPSIQTLEQLLEATKVDLTVWEVERHTINKWEVAMREPATTVGGAGNDAVISEGRHGEKSTLWTRASNKPLHENLWQIKIWLKRKSPQILAGESLIAKLESCAPVLDFPSVRLKVLPHKRAFELCVMDPHIGLLCQSPEGDGPWDMDLSCAHIMAAIDDLVKKAESFGPFEQAFMPFGNDFVHSDNLFHTTTAGTGQPEAIAWHAVYEKAESIAIAMVERVRKIAKEVYIYEVPGNHSRMADFTLARLLRAYFHHDSNVHIDASSSPYKFHRYGTSLIGYEHGHSVSAIRLAALMANERRQDWAETEYREFHLGDQHRKGSSNPAALEEQGVSIEYIPGLTVGNEWHRTKAFNHQKRGAMAFVYDFNSGPMARFQHNISQYSHKHLK